MPGPGSGASFNGHSERTTFNAHTGWGPHPVPICRAQSYTKEKNHKAESTHRVPCDVQRKLFPSDLDQNCELQGMTCCIDEFPVATDHKTIAQDQWKFKPDKMAA